MVMSRARSWIEENALSIGTSLAILAPFGVLIGGVLMGIDAVSVATGLAIVIGSAVISGLPGLGILFWIRRRVRSLHSLARQLGDIEQCDGAYYRLLKMGDHAIQIFLQALVLPRSAAQVGKTVWDADTARCLAAEGLGRLKAKNAVQPLIKLLTHPDIVLRARAAWALGEIGDSQATASLFMLLGDERRLEENLPATWTRVFWAGAAVLPAMTRVLAGLEGRKVSEIAVKRFASQAMTKW